jgi:hypothetical protein
MACRSDRRKFSDFAGPRLDEKEGLRGRRSGRTMGIYSYGGNFKTVPRSQPGGLMRKRTNVCLSVTERTENAAAPGKRWKGLTVMESDGRCCE